MKSEAIRVRVYCRRNLEGEQRYYVFADSGEGLGEHLGIFNTINEVAAYVGTSGGHLGRIVRTGNGRYREGTIYDPPLLSALAMNRRN